MSAKRFTIRNELVPEGNVMSVIDLLSIQWMTEVYITYKVYEPDNDTFDAYKAMIRFYTVQAETALWLVRNKRQLDEGV